MLSLSGTLPPWPILPQHTSPLGSSFRASTATLSLSDLWILFTEDCAGSARANDRLGGRHRKVKLSVTEWAAEPFFLLIFVDTAL